MLFRSRDGDSEARLGARTCDGCAGGFDDVAAAACNRGHQLRCFDCAGMANAARSGASAAGQRVATGAKAVKDSVASFVADAAAPAASKAAEVNGSSTPSAEPTWAKQMRRKQRMTHAATTAAHALRSGDAGGSGASPSLRDDSNS